ncbi:phosphatase PAP2 family protein [Gemmobacter sp. LW-1]|uniref:phosphatase PAP2 family protein n=1 Tax=Gemmobacter sp. LW-1 TaxID=1529005 RepID=UPI0006C75F36|nr:phosphatase PAP2 family protein [Gemmobacter sp. LW-1]
MPPIHLWHRLPACALTLAACLGLSAPVMAQDKTGLERTGDALQVILPAMAGVCAIRQQRTANFVAGLATTELVTQGLKTATRDSRIGRRPNGHDRGFPSGHTSMAFYGATSLARDCWRDSPVAGALAFGAATLVGVSRVKADQHTVGQVLAGALVGYLAHGVTMDLSGDNVAIGYHMEF